MLMWKWFSTSCMHIWNGCRMGRDLFKEIIAEFDIQIIKKIMGTRVLWTFFSTGSGKCSIIRSYVTSEWLMDN